MESLELYSFEGWIAFNILWFIGCSYFWIYYYFYIFVRNLVGRLIYGIDEFDKQFYEQYKNEERIYYWLLFVKILFITPIVIFLIILTTGFLTVEGYINVT
jgi:hypothetical protein